MRPQHEENFKTYKQSEQQAREIVAQMKATNARKNDIELALLVAFFELHLGELPPVQIGSIINGHLETLIPYYDMLMEQVRQSQPHD